MMLICAVTMALSFVRLAWQSGRRMDASKLEACADGEVEAEFFLCRRLGAAKPDEQKSA